MARLLPLVRNEVVVLFRSARNTDWAALVSDFVAAGGHAPAHPASTEHVDLMLRVAAEHAMRRFEGFNLIGPQSRWKLFFAMAFPKLEGAEAWIEAEMVPPYGSYGHHHYELARKVAPEYFNGWVTATAPAPWPRVDSAWSGSPREVPVLAADQATVVVLAFERRLPALPAADGNRHGEEQQFLRLPAPSTEGNSGVRTEGDGLTALREASKAVELMRLEVYQLICPVPDYHRIWVAEVATLERAEAWIAALTATNPTTTLFHQIQLAHKWAPEYSASWVGATKNGGTASPRSKM